MTAKDLANKMGISESALSLSLNGNPTISRVKEVADALGIDISDLFTSTIGNNNIVKCPHCSKPIKLTLSE